MKKLITTAGVAVLGSASLQAAYAPGLSAQETTKPWSVSASVRAFYDDNYATAPKETERDSFGVSVSPSITFNVVKDQTHISGGYVYDMRWYEDRSDNEIDQSHVFNVKLGHAFSENHKLDVSESFVVAQEPALLEPPGPQSTFLRTDGDNIRNLASAVYEGKFSERDGILVSYSNTFYDYDEEGNGSRSAVLDRMEHMFTLNYRRNLRDSTLGILGYQLGVIGYNDDHSLDGLTGVQPGVPFVDPEIRDNLSHYIYLGLDHSFNTKVIASLRAGAQIIDFHNLDEAPAGISGTTDDSDITPYVDGSVSWTYNPGSYMQAGVRYARNPTDIAFYGGPVPAFDQQSLAFYAAVNHRITQKLNLRLMGQFQNSEFQGGTVDGQDDNYFTAGLGLTYQFNPWLSAETGYNYDRLDSDLAGRSFTRNRVFIGLRATY